MSLHLLAETSSLRLYFDSDAQWLFAEWHGTPTLDEQAYNYELLLATLASRLCRKLLTDTSAVTVRHEWNRPARLLRQRFWRRAAAVGVQFIAEVLPAYSQPPTIDSSVTDLLWLASFTELEAACTWLSRCATQPRLKLLRSTTRTTTRPSLFQFHFSAVRRVLSPFSSSPLGLVGPALV
jgi:hypothetical protein